MNRFQKLKLIKDLKANKVALSDVRIQPLDLSYGNLINISTADLENALAPTCKNGLPTFTEEEIIIYLEKRSK